MKTTFKGECQDFIRDFNLLDVECCGSCHEDIEYSENNACELHWDLDQLPGAEPGTWYRVCCNVALAWDTHRGMDRYKLLSLWQKFSETPQGI